MWACTQACEWSVDHFAKSLFGLTQLDWQAVLAPRDHTYGEQQDAAGMHWTKRSGFNHNQIHDFQVLLSSDSLFKFHDGV